MSRAERPLLLLLAGQANSHRWWDRVRGGFEDVFDVIALDWPGTGRNRPDVGDWTTRSFAEEAAGALEPHGRPAHVYGTSMGGRVAQHLAAAHPELVDRLVLACSSPGGEHAQERSPAVRRELAVADPQQRRATLHRLFYTDAWSGTPEESTLLGDPTMSPEEQRAHLRASNAHDAWDALPTILAPTLVIHGAADQMVPAANAALLAERIPGATSWIHPVGRHGFFEEFAGEVTPRVRRFLLGS